MAVTFLSSVAVFGIVFFAVTGKKIWTYVSDFLLGLGASTILTDAILQAS